jgi:uncharacterized repeat protein (TIGR01451 family)
MSSQPSFDPGGTKLVFSSRAGDLGPADTNQSADVFLHDLATGTTSLVSVNAAGTSAANALSMTPRFSPDGTRIGFNSFGSDFGPPDSNGSPDVYVRDLSTGTTSLVSVNAAGTSGGNGFPNFQGFVGGSDRVVFRTTASNHGPVDTNGRSDVYVRDLAAGTTTLVSTNAAGTTSGNGESTIAVPSPGGPVIAFLSLASDLGPPDGNGLRDVYVGTYHDRADLSATLTAGPQPVASGGQLTFHASVTNAGPEAAVNAALVLTLPGGTSYGSGPEGCAPATDDAATVACALGRLDRGETAEIELTVTVTATGGATLDATVVAASGVFDPDGGDNRASVVVDVSA